MPGQQTATTISSSSAHRIHVVGTCCIRLTTTSKYNIYSLFGSPLLSLSTSSIFYNLVPSDTLALLKEETRKLSIATHGMADSESGLEVGL